MVATAVVGGAGLAAGRRGAVVVVFAGRVVVVVGAAVVDGAADVVVFAATDAVVVGSVPTAPASSERRMAGSLLRCGTPAMATPTAAHTTSMSAVIDRCPGLTAGPSRDRRYVGRSLTSRMPPFSLG